jgi:hypothetical protein
MPQKPNGTAYPPTADNQKLKTKAGWGKFGTVDIANTTIPSDGLKLTVTDLGSLKRNGMPL